MEHVFWKSPKLTEAQVPTHFHSDLGLTALGCHLQAALSLRLTIPGICTPAPSGERGEGSPLGTCSFRPAPNLLPAQALLGPQASALGLYCEAQRMLHPRATKRGHLALPAT